MYVRFPLPLRNVEDLLTERGIDICHEDGTPLVERSDVRSGCEATSGQPDARLSAVELASRRGST